MLLSEVISMGIEFGGKRYSEDIIVHALKGMLRDFENKKLPDTATDKELCSWLLHNLRYYEIYGRMWHNKGRY